MEHEGFEDEIKNLYHGYKLFSSEDIKSRFPDVYQGNHNEIKLNIQSV